MCIRDRFILSDYLIPSELFPWGHAFALVLLRISSVLNSGLPGPIMKIWDLANQIAYIFRSNDNILYFKCYYYLNVELLILLIFKSAFFTKKRITLDIFFSFTTILHFPKRCNKFSYQHQHWSSSQCSRYVLQNLRRMNKFWYKHCILFFLL